MYRQVLERSADFPCLRLARSVEQGRYGSRNRARHRQIARTSAAGWQPRPDAMVVDVYRHLLNREPDPEALKHAGILVSMRGSASLIDQIVDSPDTGSVSGNGAYQARASVIAPLVTRVARRCAAFRAAARTLNNHARQMRGRLLNRCIDRFWSVPVDPRASDWLDQLSRRYGSRNRSRRRQIARTSAAGWQPRPGRYGGRCLSTSSQPQTRSGSARYAGILASMRGSASLIDQIVDSSEYRQRFGEWSVPG